MTKIIVSYDREGNSLDIWWGEPTDESISDEVENGVILKKR